MIAVRGVVVNVTCWHMSAHVNTYQHMSAYPNVLTHASIQDKFQIVGIIGAGSGCTCRHISAHVGMSTGADTCRHVDKV